MIKEKNVASPQTLRPGPEITLEFLWHNPIPFPRLRDVMHKENIELETPDHGAINPMSTKDVDRFLSRFTDWLSKRVVKCSVGFDGEEGNVLILKVQDFKQTDNGTFKEQILELPVLNLSTLSPPWLKKGLIVLAKRGIVRTSEIEDLYSRHKNAFSERRIAEAINILEEYLKTSDLSKAMPFLTGVEAVHEERIRRVWYLADSVRREGPAKISFAKKESGALLVKFQPRASIKEDLTPPVELLNQEEFPNPRIGFFRNNANTYVVLDYLVKSGVLSGEQAKRISKTFKEFPYRPKTYHYVRDAEQEKFDYKPYDSDLRGEKEDEKQLAENNLPVKAIAEEGEADEEADVLGETVNPDSGSVSEEIDKAEDITADSVSVSLEVGNGNGYSKYKSPPNFKDYFHFNLIDMTRTDITYVQKPDSSNLPLFSFQNDEDGRHTSVVFVDENILGEEEERLYFNRYINCIGFIEKQGFDLEEDSFIPVLVKVNGRLALVTSYSKDQLLEIQNNLKKSKENLEFPQLEKAWFEAVI